MLTEIDTARAPIAEVGSASETIEVRRVSDQETSIIAAATAWARALEAKRRQNTTAGLAETAELALYNALADADAFESAELALYQAVLASGVVPR
ncbi:MAG TPA: hypothetical protein VN823_22155 [Stellaceae bacterium]|nr:hypothetical protein [Stellaceae bacterium]